MDYDIFLKFLIPLTATLFGALIAYTVQNYREKQKERNDQITALNKALFTLYRQINALTMIKQYIDTIRDDSSRMFKLKPLQPNTYKDLEFDFNSLTFMLNDDSSLIFDLLIEQERFQQTLKTIENRTKYQVEIIQPLLEKSGIASQTVDISKVIESIGESKFNGLVIATDEVYMHTDSTYESSNKMLKILFECSKKRFPNSKFISER